MTENGFRELPNELTPVSIAGLANAFLLAWESTGQSPTRKAVELKVAHVHFETGLKDCHNWNLGNVKCPVGGNGKRHWQFYKCGEELDLKQAEDMARQSPLVALGTRYQREGSEKVSVTIYPKHPGCCFRAFETLRDAVRDQLEFIVKRPAAWNGLQSGDPGLYTAGLFAARYFTADPVQYERRLTKRLHIVQDELRKWNGWGDVT